MRNMVKTLCFDYERSVVDTQMLHNSATLINTFVQYTCSNVKNCVDTSQ
jgi:hypothetical protein